MTFTYKLAQRLARLKTPTAIVAAAIAVATIFSCELPVRTSDPGSTIAQLVVSPSNVTLQPSQGYDFTAVGFTANGDSADISVTWSASGGSVASSTSGKRHYGHYQNAGCGAFNVVSAWNRRGFRSGTCARMRRAKLTCVTEPSSTPVYIAAQARCSEQSRRKAVTQSHGATADSPPCSPGRQRSDTGPRRPGTVFPRRGVP